MLKEKITIINETGLHARPASILVQAASDFLSEIEIDHEDKHINAKSIINVLSLGLRKDDVILLSIEGVDEAAAMKDLKTLFESGFGDS
jgi:phosphocarrier protein